MPPHRTKNAPSTLSSDADSGATPSIGPRDDELIRELVARAKTGDVQAWARLYQDFFDRTYRHICYLAGDPGLTEDLVQDTFARAMVSVTTFSGRSTFSTWLLGIARNVVLMHRRRAKSKVRVHDQAGALDRARLDPGRGDPDRAHTRDERLRALYLALDTLPESLRDVFILRELRGLEVKEVAELLEISPSNVAVRTHRARARVRDELGSLGWLDGESTS